jgi:excinuclease UvrABC nuclease subunit
MKHYKLIDETFIVLKTIPDKPGIYKIVALNEDDLPMNINRVLDTDQSGTLYIGKAENLRKRIANLKRAFLPEYKSTKHIGARRFHSIKSFSLQFPIHSLAITFELSKENETARELEAEKFRIYEKFMGERPPLNRQ